MGPGQVDADNELLVAVADAAGVAKLGLIVTNRNAPRAAAITQTNADPFASILASRRLGAGNALVVEIDTPGAVGTILEPRPSTSARLARARPNASW